MALIGSLDSGVNAMRSFSKGIEVIGNNIANVNTTGFKGATVSYEDNFSQMLSRASGANSNTSQIGTGSSVSAITNNFTQGSISTTDVYSNLAINGNGFFQVRDTGSSELFATRAGNFMVDDVGNLQTPEGLRVQGLNGGGINYAVSQVAGQLVYTPTVTSAAAAGTVGDINLSNNISYTADASVVAFTAAQIEAGLPGISSVSFDKKGTATVYLENGDSYQRGQVMLMGFTNPNALEKVGSNLYSNFSAAGMLGGTAALDPATNTAGTNGLGTFKTSSAEGSNVDLTQEFANLITTQRSFQAASRIITVSDSILQEIIDLKR